MISHHKRFITIIIVCLFLSLSSCDEKETYTIYEKPDSEKRDPTFKWLYDINNSYKPNFTAVFYTHYNQLIKENKIEKTANILDSDYHRKARNLSFKKEFTATVNNFISKYQAKLPLNKTLYINSYFSDLYREKGDYKTAIFHALKTTNVEVTDYNSCRKKAFAFSDLSFCYFSLGNQNAAIPYNFKALEFYKQIKSTNGLGRVCNNLASIYFASNDYANAELYYDKTFKCFKKVNDLENVFIALGNKIIVCEDLKNNKLNALIDSTYTYFNQYGIQSDGINNLFYC